MAQEFYEEHLRDLGNQRARVARDNQRTALIFRQVERDVAYIQLKQVLNLPVDQPLVDAGERDHADPVAAPPAALGRSRSLASVTFF